MKISNSKKQLAKIISENGGWRDGAQFSAQDKDGEVFHYAAKPTIGAGREVWSHKGCIGEGEFPAKTLPNWHQTILSRDEYFHLYPAPDAEVSVYGDSTLIIPGDPLTAMRRMQDSLAFDAGPTIEQLAADYRNRKDYADRKQEEADAAKADAEAKLAELVAAGTALGLVLSVAGVALKRATFHNSAVGAPKTYAPELSTEVCDGCGKAAGRHFSLMMFCSHEDIENA